MTLLLDTHTILWMTEQVPRLGRLARRSCDAALAANELIVPTAVFYEVGRAVMRDRLAALADVREWRRHILALGVREVGLSAEVAVRASEFDNLHGDPIDRIIMASALAEDAILLTADRSILEWPGNLQRQDATR
ncbi:MAG: type II toxin-antitoxin system VapC family toxin [Proteobacteria bacterium]|nr:type II toxin-antitoxin system VapC family toxin [Pseudomonadota bacterium]